MPYLLFVSGSSGAGKTAALQCVKEKLSGRPVSILHFDSMGIPSREEMIRQAGSLERWQEMATHSWVERIQQEFKSEDLVILEGQANPDFFTAGCARHGLKGFALVLLDCDWETRSARLIHARNQPELANPEMKNWSNFLRNQARQKGIRIVDTTRQSVQAVADELIALLPPK